MAKKPASDELPIEQAAAGEIEIVSFRDELPCHDSFLARGQKLGTIQLEPGVPLGFFVRAIQDSLAGQKSSLVID